LPAQLLAISSPGALGFAILHKLAAMLSVSFLRWTMKVAAAAKNLRCHEKVSENVKSHHHAVSMNDMC
jgi:hypothetical protein